MRQNQALARQRAGQLTFGQALAYDSADLAKQVAHLGFDRVWLDWQHGQGGTGTWRSDAGSR